MPTVGPSWPCSAQESFLVEFLGPYMVLGIFVPRRSACRESPYLLFCFFDSGLHCQAQRGVGFTTSAGAMGYNGGHISEMERNTLLDMLERTWNIMEEIAHL